VIPYSFHPEAEAELAGATLFGSAWGAFETEVERTVSMIREQHPEAGSRAGLPHRRMLVRRFPYWIVYRADQDSVLVLAVAHQRRRPGYWRPRT
jgi:plasmid stabilization system protein ParE